MKKRRKGLSTKQVVFGFATKYVDRRCNFRKISAVAILPLKLAREDKHKFSWFNKFLPMSGLWLRFNFIWLTITLFGYAWKTSASIWNLCGLKPLVTQVKCGRNILISKQSRSRTQTNTWTNIRTHVLRNVLTLNGYHQFRKYIVCDAIFKGWETIHRPTISLLPLVIWILILYANFLFLQGHWRFCVCVFA